MPAVMGSFWSRAGAVAWKYKLLFLQLILSFSVTVALYILPPDQLPTVLTSIITPASLKTFSFGFLCALVTRARRTLGQIIGRNARYVQEKYGWHAGTRRTKYQHAILDLIAFLNQIEKVDSREERQIVHDIMGFQDVTGMVIHISEERTTAEEALVREIQRNPGKFWICEASSECLRCVLVIRNSKDHYLVTELDHVFRVKGLVLPAGIIGSRMLLAGELSIDHRPSGYALRFEILRDLPVKGVWQPDNIVLKILTAKKEARGHADDETRRSGEPFALGRKMLENFSDISMKQLRSHPLESEPFLPDGGDGTGNSYFVLRKEMSNVPGTQVSLWKAGDKAIVQGALQRLNSGLLP